VGTYKLYVWRGPETIEDPDVDEAGVGWILAENWWPYQRPSFVTPPFAGYVSGHSTYSRAASEVLTLFTGDEFFPGGVGRFEAPNTPRCGGSACVRTCGTSGYHRNEDPI